jgi:hypothetical protein
MTILARMGKNSLKIGMWENSMTSVSTMATMAATEPADFKYAIDLT